MLESEIIKRKVGRPKSLNIIEITKDIDKEKGPIKDLYQEFMSDYLDAECFESEESLYKYWSKEQNFERLKSGEYGKLNMLYTYKIVLGLRDEFSDFLLKLTQVSNSL